MIAKGIDIPNVTLVGVIGCRYDAKYPGFPVGRTGVWIDNPGVRAFGSGNETR